MDQGTPNAEQTITQEAYHPLSRGIPAHTSGANSALRSLPDTHSISLQWPRQACTNDPSAGSPTETLLRLLLPLSDKVHQT